MFSKRCATHVDTFTWIRNKCHKLGNVPTHKDIFTWINSRYKAFTMAEVIVTIGIIGVVAAMTLTPLINTYKKKTTAAKLKQAYNFLQRTFVMAQNEYGDMKNWECSAVGSCTPEQFAKKYIIPYFQDPHLKTYSALINAGYKSYPKGLNGATTMTGWRYYIKTNQGYYYMVSVYDVGQDRRVYEVSIDINGTNPPNTVGKDIFNVTYGYNLSKRNHYKLQMYNYLNRNREQLLKATDGCNKNGIGGYCGALIEMDGWEIKDDYPWD